MQIKPELPPEGQDAVVYKFVSAVTRNPKEAQRITRFGEKPQVTDSVHDAQLVFGSLMQGVAVQPKSGFNPIEQVETLLGMMAQFVQRAGATGVWTPNDTLGMNSVALYVQAQIQRIAGDKREKQRVKAYGDELGKIMNAVKALDQRSREAAAAQSQNGNGDGGEMQKMMQQLQENQLRFEQKMRQQEANWQTRSQQREEGFQKQERRNELQHQIDLRRQQEESQMDRINQTLTEATKRMGEGGPQ
jgi:hypothetical protein